MIPRRTEEEEFRTRLRRMLQTRRELEGEEYDHMRLILSMMVPQSSFNSQRTCTDVYVQNGKIYHVHEGIYGNRPMIEEVTNNAAK